MQKYLQIRNKYVQRNLSVQCIEQRLSALMTIQFPDDKNQSFRSALLDSELNLYAE